MFGLVHSIHRASFTSSAGVKAWEGRAVGPQVLFSFLTTYPGHQGSWPFLAPSYQHLHWLLVVLWLPLVNQNSFS